jgi:bifunctional ADP-heptose synthase (sugar kinase/adenylyltransferase)
VFLLSTRVDADLRRLAINPTVMGENRMFKTAAAAEPITDVMDPADTVPLSVLALDLDAPSAGGWHAYLASRGIAVLVDDVGRDSITKADARRLFDERREHEIRRRQIAARQEQAALEADRAFRAGLPKGLHWTDIPVGVSAAQVWA